MRNENEFLCIHQTFQNIQRWSPGYWFRFSYSDLRSQIERVWRFQRQEIKWKARLAENKSHRMGRSAHLSNWKTIHPLLQQLEDFHIPSCIPAYDPIAGQDTGAEDYHANKTWHRLILFRVFDVNRKGCLKVNINRKNKEWSRFFFRFNVKSLSFLISFWFDSNRKFILSEYDHRQDEVNGS